MDFTKAFLCCGVATLFAGSTALGTGTSYDLNVDGIASWDSLSDPSNTVLAIDIASALGFDPGTPMTMNGIGWDVTIETVGSSWLSEARIYFDDNINPDLTGLFLTPGFADSFSGTGSYFSEVVKLADFGIEDIPLPDGVLRVEFFEGFDDVSDAIDAFWSGTITLQFLPAPATAALLALGVGLVGNGRRRRR